MSPGLRLFVMATILAFLVVAGLLGGLQQLQSESLIVNPVMAAEVHAQSFPIPGIGGAEPYKVFDARKQNRFAAVYLKSGEQPSDGVLMIVSRLPLENVREGGEDDRGLQREWKEGSFAQLGDPRQQLFRFREQSCYATAKEYVNDAGVKRSQFSLPLEWGEDRVWVQVNGPSEVVTAEALQQALDAVEGEAQTLEVPEAEEGEEEGEEQA